MRRSRSDDNQKPLVNHWRKHGGSAVITSSVGGGFVDTVLGKDGITLLAEFKNPAGRGTALRESQQKFRREWKGGPIVEISSVVEMDPMLLRPLVTGVRQAVDEAAWAIANNAGLQFWTRDERQAAATAVLDALVGKLLGTMA